MRKEVLIAVIIGLVLGGIITFGIYTANQSNNRQEQEPQTNVTPSPSPIENLFQLSSPQDGDILSTSTATLSGSLKSDTYLVISTDQSDYFVKPNSDNSFSQSITLTQGANPIKLTAIDFDNNRQELTINLVYTTAKLK